MPEIIAESSFGKISLSLCEITKGQLNDLGIDEVQYLHSITQLILSINRVKPDFLIGSRRDLSETLKEGLTKIKLQYVEGHNQFECKINGGCAIFHIPKQWLIDNLETNPITI